MSKSRIRRTEFDRNAPLRFVIYARVSSQEQNPRSPERQADEIRTEIRRQGLPWIEDRVFVDQGISGRVIRRRPAFVEMLELIRRGDSGIDLVIVDTPERIGRNDSVDEIRRMLARNGVLLLTAISHFRDPTTREGRLMALIDDTSGEAENEVKGHQVSGGKIRAVNDRRWPGGPPPLGYRVEVLGTEKRGSRDILLKHLVPDPRTKILVEQSFALAKANGWGATRLTKALNASTEIPADLKPIYANTVARILSNPIYVGKRIWGKYAAGYDNDIRIVEQNSEEEWTVVDNYCEPLVAEDDFNVVQAQHNARRESWLASRSDEAARSPQPGVALKFPLSGLVVCAGCGRNMAIARRNRSETSEGAAVYHCPYVAAGDCQNRAAVPESWLRQEVMQRLVSRLSLGEDESSTSITAERLRNSPLFVEFQSLIEAELARQEAARPTALESLRAEHAGLQRQQDGIVRSLSDPELDSTLRRRLQEDFTMRTQRMTEIDIAVQNAAGIRATVNSVSRPDMIAEALARIALVVQGENATAANLELARVIAGITVDAAGVVRIKMCKLAVVVAPQFLSSDAGDPDDCADAGRRLPARAVPTDLRDELRGEPRSDSSFRRCRFGHLRDEWFWIDTLQIPERLSWAQAHALKAANSRLAEPCGLTTLAKRFGVTKITIRRALEHAKELGVNATKIDGRTLHANWARDHAQEVAKFLEMNAGNIALAAKEFRKSRPWIRQAVLFAAEQIAKSNAEPSGDAAESTAA